MHFVNTRKCQLAPVPQNLGLAIDSAHGAAIPSLNAGTFPERRKSLRALVTIGKSVALPSGSFYRGKWGKLTQAPGQMPLGNPITYSPGTLQTF